MKEISSLGFRVKGPVPGRYFPVTCEACGSGLTRKAVIACNATDPYIILGQDCAKRLIAEEKVNRGV